MVGAARPLNIRVVAGVVSALVVVDDVTLGLDASLQGAVLDLIHRIATAGPWATLVASGDRRVLRALADRVLVLRSGTVVVDDLVDSVLGTDGTVPW